jgi:hypothetical protein
MKTQKELKQMFEDILRKDVWRGSERMVQHCLKESAYVVELQNGDIITISKPRIETSFCFGYSDSPYDNKDYDRANNMADHASKNENYFMEQNLKDIDNTISRLEGKKHNNYEYYTRISYTGQPENSKLKSLNQIGRFDNVDIAKYKKLEETDRERIIDGYKIVREDFLKRLKTYLKKYGLSKVKTWSYWKDA